MADISNNQRIGDLTAAPADFGGATVGANPQTGQIAIKRADGLHIYDPGMYRLNATTGQIAVPVPGGGYEIHDLSPTALSYLTSPDAILARQTDIPGDVPSGLSQGNTPDFSPAQSAARGALQGISLGTSDEASGAAEAAVNATMGNQVPVDPNHPVTGGTTSGFGANYLQAVGQERALNAQAKTQNPKVYKGSMLAAGVIPALATPARSIPQAMVGGAGLGAGAGAGYADSQDPYTLLINSLMGGLIGGASGGVGRGLYKVGFEDSTPTGIAYRALNAAAPGSNIGNIQVRPSAAPAELDPGMADLLRTAGAANGNAAAAAIPRAQARMGAVDQAITNRVNALSPVDSALLSQDIQRTAQTQNAAAYGAAHASPVTVGLPPNTTNRLSFQQALRAAQAAAQDEDPPRNIDPTNLSAQDIDLIDRMLRGAQSAAIDSRGDSSEAAQVAKALIPTRGQVATTVRTVADGAFPELATARAGAARFSGLQDAIDLGGTWLSNNKSPEQVGQEFAGMTAEQQQAALSGFATDIRNALGTKSAQANLGQFFERTNVAEKLRNVGVPDAVIDAMTRGGAGARQVLNALQQGSMTARNLAGAAAMKSSLSSVSAGDLTAAAVTHSPGLAMALPAARAVGNAAERGGAAQIINALTNPGSGQLVNLINRAPQTWAGILTAPARSAGNILGLIQPRRIPRGASTTGYLPGEPVIDMGSNVLRLSK